MAGFSRFSGLFTRSLEREAIKIAALASIDTIDASLQLLKEKLLDAVKQHPVCKELENLTLPSKFVPSKSGTASLFGFLGFPADATPVDDLISFLDENVQIKTRRKFVIVGRKIITSLIIPTKEEMSSDGRLDLPWANVAWPIMIENGVSGLRSGVANFLQAPHSMEASQSQLGIQIKGITREEMSPIPFLSVIFKDFREKFGS